MNENADREFNRSFFGIMGGVLSAIAAGFLLKLILEKVFHADPFTVSSINIRSDDLKIEIALGIWLFISSLAGGLACVTISGKNDVSHVIISSLVVLALYFFISGGGILKGQSLASWTILLTIPFGYFVGEWMGSRKRE
ncbi:MAG: hypothetical protein ACHQEB_02575 [Chitinophagales bacterium]